MFEATKFIRAPAPPTGSSLVALVQKTRFGSLNYPSISEPLKESGNAGPAPTGGS